MKFCPYCRSELVEGKPFCAGCGEKIPVEASQDAQRWKQQPLYRTTCLQEAYMQNPKQQPLVQTHIPQSVDAPNKKAKTPLTLPVIAIGFVLILIIVVSTVLLLTSRGYECRKLTNVDADYLESKGLNVSSGGYVLFGEYEQDGDTEQSEPIEWIPLGTHDNKLLMISRYALDVCDRGYETWEESNIREWLNNEFLSYAFSKEERRKIVPTQNDNPIVTDTNKIKISGEESTTTDTVFLLSIPEVESYLGDPSKRYTKATPYAISRGALVSENGNTWWTLRTTDGNFVGAESGYGLTAYTAFRPAIWIELP